MEKQTYVAPGCEVVYVRTEMNIMSQENSDIVGPLGARRNDDFDHYDGYHDPFDR